MTPQDIQAGRKIISKLINTSDHLDDKKLASVLKEAALCWSASLDEIDKLNEELTKLRKRRYLRGAGVSQSLGQS